MSSWRIAFPKPGSHTARAPGYSFRTGVAKMPKGKGKKWKEEESRKGDKKRERATKQALRKERQYLKEGDPEFKSLSNQLATQGLRMKDVPGDG